MTLYRLPDYQINCWTLGSGEEVQNRFQRQRLRRHLIISDQNDFSNFDLLPRCFLSSFKSVGLLFQEKKRKIDFQDKIHLGFPIGTILATFYLQVTPKLPTKFHVNWPFSSGEAIDFKHGGHDDHVGFPI